METTFKFTAARLAALPAPEGGEETYYDADTPGLRVRVRPTGAAAYGVRYRITGDTRGPQRLTLGAVGVTAAGRGPPTGAGGPGRGQDGPRSRRREAGGWRGAGGEAQGDVERADRRPRTRSGRAWRRVCGGGGEVVAAGVRGPCWAATRTRSHGARSSASSTGCATAFRVTPPPGPVWSRRCGREFMDFWRGPRTPGGFGRTSWPGIAPRGGARLRGWPRRRTPPAQ